MKKLLVLILCLASIAGIDASAQLLPDVNPEVLPAYGRKGTTLTLDKVKLDPAVQEAILLELDENMPDYWKHYAAERNWGIGLLSGGYTLMVAGACFGGIYFLAGLVGTIFVAIGGQEAVDNLWNDIGPMATAGFVVGTVGFAAGTTGLVLLIVGNKKLNHAVDLCNENIVPRPAALTFGPTASGVGLALNF